jgi:hypothetical protein
MMRRPWRENLALVRWSDEENLFLKNNYATTSLADLEFFLSHRTGNAIKQQAGVLGLWGVKTLDKYPEWLPHELAILHDYYPDNGIQICCAFLPNRSRNAVALKVKRLGVRKRGSDKPNRIGSQEWNFILQSVANIGFVECAERVADTPDNLRDKCSRRGIDCDAIDRSFNGRDFIEGPYTAPEIAYLKGNFPSQGGVRVGLKLGRSPKKIINYAKRHLGLKTNGPVLVPPFTVLSERL